jgi:diguanylate cyclase (GGDEF)-like protein/PAS domain S-box-containing protein
MTVMHGGYDYRLVALSVVLSMFASYAALDLAERVTAAQDWTRGFWLGTGAGAMGLGIWAMHYVGMLALSMPIPVFYHLPTVVFSLLAAIAASAVALFAVSRAKVTLAREILGSAVMGGGIAAMHYIGMDAMRCAAAIQYDWRIVGLSIALAVAISFVALKLAFRVRDEKRATRRKVISAVVMGSAIPLMHYTGMWAATFHPSKMAPNLVNTISISTIGLVAITASSLFVLSGAIASVFFDRVIALQKLDLYARERELYFQTMAEAVPEILWTADPKGEDDFFNGKCFDYTGLTFEEIRGSGWKRMVHPDDVEGTFLLWQKALRDGQPYEVEYRLRGKDGNFRWFLGRANPIRNSAGEIIKWFGTCTDIESQKQSLQILEQQILERTMQLADANAQLQREMSEKDFARSQLDQQKDKMMSELKERSERATMLAKMGELLQSCISRDEVTAAALGFAPKIFPTARGAVALLNASRSVADVIGSWSDCQLPMMEFESSECWALRTGQPHLVAVGDRTARCPHVAGVECSYLCIPILAQGETLGILHLQATSPSQHMEMAELSFKTTFAGQMGLSIANIRLREALRIQSVRDPLTGLYNRRFLEETLDREVRRATRAQQSLGVLMIDLDHFKAFNDTYGHDSGDAVLRETAASLAKGIRAEDFVCRFGGEEFVVVLPTANVEAAQARAESLRLKMKELNVLHQGKSIGMVTISVGVAALPQHGKSPSELISAADAALYQAKRGGRDRVVTALSPASEEAALQTAGV